MGISGFLTGLAKTAGAAAPVLANMQAAKQQAAAQGLMQQRQQMLQLLAMQMAQKKQDIQNALAQSTIGKNAAQGSLANARVKALENPPVSLGYQTDKDGNIVGLPTKVTPGQAVTPVQTGVKGLPKTDPLALHKAERDYDNAHPGQQPGVFVVNPSDPTAPATYTPRNKAFGQAQPQHTANASPVNLAASARMNAAISEMNNADANMSDYEHKLATGQVHINAGAQVLSRVANAFTHDDPASQLAQSGALSLLNTTDPELARYIRRGLSFAEGESMISQRPSDFRTRMAAFLSTAASGASPEMVSDIQSRRHSILSPLNDVVAKQNGQRAPQGQPTGDINLGAKPAKVPTFEEWMATHGHKP